MSAARKAPSETVQRLPRLCRREAEGLERVAVRLLAGRSRRDG